MEFTKYIINPIYATYKVLYDKITNYNNTKKINRINNNIDKMTQISCFFSDPIHIIDNIYLGSAFNAASYYKLEEYNIKTIINVTSEISNYYPNNFEYKNYLILDINEDSIEEYLEDSYNYINNHLYPLEDNKNILIHCFMGASRSASILTYYIMKKYNKSFDETVDFICDKRIIVNLNTTFADEIKKSL